MATRILVAEDDVKQCDLLRIYLEREGHIVHLVRDGDAALRTARSVRPDLIVLDVMMPKLNGLDVCRTLRAESGTPILMLTARSTEDDMLLGLDLGADDYITKPYSPRELTARIRALLRRHAAPPDERPPVLRVGPLVVDPARFEVRIGDAAVVLTAKEFAVLQLLAAEPGRVFTRAEIIDRAFDLDHDVLSRTVDAHVMNLRRKLEEVHPRRCLETVYGRGYRLVDPEA